MSVNCIYYPLLAGIVYRHKTILLNEKEWLEPKDIEAAYIETSLNLSEKEPFDNKDNPIKHSPQK